MVSRLRAGFSFSMVSPVEIMPKLTDTPILFITAENDDYVPTYMTHDLAEAKAGPKQFLEIPEATHGKGYTVNPEMYKEGLYRFLSTVNPVVTMN